jgi:hypothetical protein
MPGKQGLKQSLLPQFSQQVGNTTIANEGIILQTKSISGNRGKQHCTHGTPPQANNNHNNKGDGGEEGVSDVVTDKHPENCSPTRRWEKLPSLSAGATLQGRMNTRKNFPSEGSSTNNKRDEDDKKESGMTDNEKSSLLQKIRLNDIFQSGNPQDHAMVLNGLCIAAKGIFPDLKDGSNPKLGPAVNLYREKNF